MSKSSSRYLARPSPPKRLVLSTLIAVVGASLVLVAVVLPAEYGIDPTGIGRLLRLTAIRVPVRTFEISDILGGNEDYREVEIPDFGDPVPLPNPAVYQDEPQPPRRQTLEIAIPPEQETEIKLVLKSGKMIQYSWQIDHGQVYVDFHGHDPKASPEFWVRYKEQQEGSRNNGSLVAPFSGEHGWYWLNYNEFPVTISLNVSGYYDDIVDYGIF